jgi:hypothetical protein
LVVVGINGALQFPKENLSQGVTATTAWPLAVGIRGYPSLDMGPTWTAYILGPFYTSLPRRWRRTLRHGSETFVARCAIVSGLLESVVALGVLRAMYLAFFSSIESAYIRSLYLPGHNTIAAPEFVGEAGFLAFALNPVTWVPLYLFVEGVLRSAAAAVSGEVYGVLPLFAVDCVHRLIARRRRAPALPLVCDEVLPGDGACEFRIASCRKRTDWNYPFTMRFRGGFFQVTAEDNIGVGARPYVYSFRRLPPGAPARGLRDYSPDDVLIHDPLAG